MVTEVNHVVSNRAIVVMPIEGDVVSGGHLDSVRDLVVSQNIAAHVDGVQVLDWGIGVPPRRRTVICWCANAVEGPLVHAIDEHTLRWLVSWLCRVRRGGIPR